MKLNPIYRGILCCSLAVPATALAQDSGEAIEEIVVTGSLIRGTPEDAALPVEVHTMEDMRLSGSPSALEFAKSLTSSGPTSGEAYYFGGAELTGNVQYNLRGLGADKTLVLFDGRRVHESTTPEGGSNSSIIPYAALQRVEVLKDGAAVTYGADATGGVVNFIPRESYEGFEFDASYKAISDSDGEYNLSMLGGFGSGDTNIMWSAEWEHRSELDTLDRDVSSQPYAVNPAPTSHLTNLSAWFAHASLPPTPNPTLTDPLAGTDLEGRVFAPTGEFGTLLAMVNDFDAASCAAVGGTPGALDCRYNYASYYNLVEEQDTYRLFGQVTSAVSDKMDFHLRLGFARINAPAVEGSPSQPVIRGTALHEGATGQFYVPRTNPYFDEFANRTGLVDATADHDGDPNTPEVPVYGAVQGVTAFTYRAFAHGGNPYFAEGNNSSVASTIDNKYWHLSTGVDGEWDNGIGYDFGITYNHGTAYADSPDLIAHRLQEALNGFGGPNCNAADLDDTRFGTQNPAAAGQNGCMWYNPFASNFAGQPLLGLSNPAYGGADYTNSPELVHWLFDKRAAEEVVDNLTVDFVLNGVVPGAELPGGAVAWGAGLQWRQTHSRETVFSDFYNGSQPCVWPNESGQSPQPPTINGSPNPDYNGCTPDRPGPFQFFGTNPPDRLEQEQESAFVEFNLPVLDSLNITAAGRYEEFSGGLDATVYKVSAKWQATENLALRGAFGTNYQAPGIGIVPGEIDNGVNNFTVAGGAWLGAQTVTRSDIEPETAKVGSLGVIWQSAGFTDDSDFRIIVDYFDIQTEDEISLLASANDIADAVFSIDNGSNPNLADCSHPLVNRVTFNGGCTQGVTDATGFSSISTERGNGPGQSTAGYDIQVSYGFPFMDGDLRFEWKGTRVVEDINEETVLDGYVLQPEDDRLGYLNYETIAFASSKWRTNLSTNFAKDIHNTRFVLNYISGVDDERYLLPNGSLNTSALTVGGNVSDYGVKGEDWISADIHYNVDLPWNATFSASVLNLTDREPPESRQELGYDPRIGNPLGRMFEIGFQKRF
ncbi:TonB-dependent receptor domain-containing protein [Gilvimarinus sp. F26214L]|uniref:TonB-dependent receptor domain-containing protein n=1 Tax=Gilvimarinus sp. DZF01 TaxID=3461371 RepID=UPI004045CC7B